MSDVDEAFAREWGDWRKHRPLAERDWIKGWFKRGWEARERQESDEQEQR